MFGGTYNGWDFVSCKLDGRVTTLLTFALGVASSLLWIWHPLHSLLTLFQTFLLQSRGCSSRAAAGEEKQMWSPLFEENVVTFMEQKAQEAQMVFSNVVSVQRPSLNFQSTTSYILSVLKIYIYWLKNMYLYLCRWRQLYYLIDPNLKMIGLNETSRSTVN